MSDPAVPILHESILRLEHKVDALLRYGCVPIMPMHFVGLTCPACQMPIDYTVDIKAGVVVRRCNCRTGKVAATIPLLPVAGDPNVVTDEPVRQPAGDDQTSPSPSRKAR